MMVQEDLSSSLRGASWAHLKKVMLRTPASPRLDVCEFLFLSRDSRRFNTRGRRYKHTWTCNYSLLCKKVVVDQQLLKSPQRVLWFLDLVSVNLIF